MPTNPEIRSESVQEILTQVPSKWIRYGNTLLFALVILVIALSFFIKYPDIVTADIKITTPIPPEKLIAKSTGRLQKILVKNNKLVTANQPLAIIENTANNEKMLLLVQDLNTPFSEALMESVLLNYANANLGNVQQAFTLFEKDYRTYKQYQSLNPYQVEKSSQNYEKGYQNTRITLLQDQLIIAEKELALKQKELERFKQLYQKGIIALQEWEAKNFDFLQTEKSLKNIKSQLSQLQSGLNELQKNQSNTTINQTKDDVNLYRNCVQSLAQLQKAVNDWEMQYVLKSSITGKVSYLQIWTESQMIATGDEVFVVVPAQKGKYLGKITAKAQNSGKIEKNQQVNIRLANFPDIEYGIINGKIEHIAATPNKEGNLIIDVVLPYGLQTSYQKNIPFKQEMTGTADIITQDLRLIDRILFQFRSMVSR